MGYHYIYIPQPIIAMYGYSALKCIPPCVPFGGSELCVLTRASGKADTAA